MHLLTRNTRVRVIRAIARCRSCGTGLLVAAFLAFLPMRVSAAQLAANQHNSVENAKPGNNDKLTPEQMMRKRFPQPVRVGDLIGLPLLDEWDSTVGYVKNIIRSPAGHVFLIVPYSAHFGWVRVEWGKRPVAVPIEVVGLLGRQIALLDLSREDLDEAPTWTKSQDKTIPPDETTLVALGRR
jgi:hypothetical protein